MNDTYIYIYKIFRVKRFEILHLKYELLRVALCKT